MPTQKNIMVTIAVNQSVAVLERRPRCCRRTRIHTEVGYSTQKAPKSKTSAMTERSYRHSQIYCNRYQYNLLTSILSNARFAITSARGA